MAEQIPIIDIGIAVVVALGVGTIFKKLKLGTSVGYIIAGLILGPIFLGFLTPGKGLAPVFGEIGIMLLLFYLGLELSLKKLTETGVFSTALVLVQMIFGFAFGFFIAKVFGFSNLEAIVIGSLLPMASTAIIGNFVLEKRISGEPEGRIALSSLVIEDFAGVFILVFISGLVLKQSSFHLISNSLFFVIAMFYVVRKISKYALNFLHAYGQADKMVLYAIGIGILVAYLGTFLGLSPIVGAYFAGFALAESAYGMRIKKEIGFFREFFILFFFVSFGSTLFYDSEIHQIIFPEDPFVLIAIVSLLVAANILANFIAFAFIGNALGISANTSVNIALLMSLGIGEFGIIIASTAAGILPRGSDILSIAFMLTISSTLVGYFLYSKSKCITSIFLKIYPKNLRDFFSRRFSSNVIKSISFSSRIQSEYYSSLKKLFAYLVTVVAIVYVLSLFNLDFSLFPGLSPEISLGLIVLPLIIWPIYNMVEELRFLSKKASESILRSVFPLIRLKKVSFESPAGEVVVSLLLTGIGFIASVFFYYSTNLTFVVIPISYTLISAMYLSRSIYSLFEKYESLEEITREEGAQEKSLLHLSKEFDEEGQKFRELTLLRSQAKEQIQEAIQAGDFKKARALFHAFKKKETASLIGLISMPALIREVPLFRKMTGLESKEVRDALRKYNLRYPISPSKSFCEKISSKKVRKKKKGV